MCMYIYLFDSYVQYNAVTDSRYLLYLAMICCYSLFSIFYFLYHNYLDMIRENKRKFFMFNYILVLFFMLTAHIVEDRRTKIPTNSSTGNRYSNNNNSGKNNNNANISVQYYARVFISVKGDQRSRFSRSSNNLNLNSSNSSSSSVGGTEGVGFADSEGTTKYLVFCFVLLRTTMNLLLCFPTLLITDVNSFLCSAMLSMQCNVLIFQCLSILRAALLHYLLSAS